MKTTTFEEAYYLLSMVHKDNKVLKLGNHDAYIGCYDFDDYFFSIHNCKNHCLILKKKDNPSVEIKENKVIFKTSYGYSVAIECFDIVPSLF